MNTATSLQIAETIRAQLGGQRFAAMVGARDFAGGSNWLQFKFYGKATNKANLARVTLETDDSYLVEFYRVRSFDANRVSLHRGVMFDQLQTLFTAQTGLLTSL